MKHTRLEVRCLALGLLMCLFVTPSVLADSETLKKIQDEYDKIEGTLARLMNIVESHTTLPDTTTEGAETVQPNTSTEGPNPDTTPSNSQAPDTTTEGPGPDTTTGGPGPDSTTGGPGPDTTTDDSASGTTFTSTPPDVISDGTAAKDALRAIGEPESDPQQTWLERRLQAISDKGVGDEVFCTPATNTTDDLCTRLINTLDEIEEVSVDIAKGMTTETELMRLQNASVEFDNVVDDIEKDPDFIESLEVDALRERTDNLEQVIENAEAKVEEKLNNEDDHTLAIVLGTLGGVLGVALIAGGGYVFYTKKHKKSKHELISMEEQGDTNPAFTKGDESKNQTED